ALGTAYWYASGAGRFVTSTWYRDALPAWLEEWNATDPALAWRDVVWRPLAPLPRYAARYADDRPFEVGYGHLDRTFPHPLAGDDAEATRKAIRYTPLGDELLLELTKRLIRGERIGLGPATDFLSISFSATDYVGHAWGPLSLEAEDNVLRLDRTLADLFAFVDREIGLGRTAVVLSSDHGIEPCPETQRGRSAGRHVSGEVEAALNRALDDRLGGGDGDLIEAFWAPDVHLDEAAVARRGLDVDAVARTVAAVATGIEGIDAAFTRADLLSGRGPSDPRSERVRRSFHPDRSGDVVLVAAPFWSWHAEVPKNAATHGSPYRYDTHVPLLFLVPGVRPRVVHRPVAPSDVAPTLATLLGLPWPSGATGEALGETLPPGHEVREF
ncbi:MAG: alkaline phosphatase family protein, partial [Planctomycetota bacterium JB042]